MVYERCTQAEPIQQGDIFAVFRVTISLQSLAVLDENDEARELSWEQLLTEVRQPTVNRLASDSGSWHRDYTELRCNTFRFH